MASRRSERQENVRFQVLRLISENPNMSSRQVANAVGISNGAAYYCVNALVKKGLLKLGNFTTSRNKMHYVYILTPKGISEKLHLTSAFLLRKQEEYLALRDEITSLEEEIKQQI